VFYIELLNHLSHVPRIYVPTAILLPVFPFAEGWVCATLPHNAKVVRVLFFCPTRGTYIHHLPYFGVGDLPGRCHELRRYFRLRVDGIVARMKFLQRIDLDSARAFG
jgi:hypothetical protein